MNPQLVKADVSKFHIYTLEWYKDKLVFLLDGNLCYQFVNILNLFLYL